MKNVVITGGTRGIGLAMSKEFLESGCNVTVCGKSYKNLEKCKDELKNYDDNVLYVQCNVADKADVERLWVEAKEKWESIDIWINNAGQNSPYEFSWDIDEKYVEQLVDTNIKGVIYGSQVASKHMIEQGYGQIWNMEGLGSNDSIIEKTILYGTSKRALTYFTKALAKEISKTNVRVGRLSPGMVLTDFMTQSPDGEKSKALENHSFKKIFNILGEKPEVIAKYLVTEMLKNKKNNGHIEWLTKSKSAKKFIIAPFKKEALID